jgi:hypothetical protein
LVRSLGGEAKGAKNWAMVVSPDWPTRGGPNSQADRGRKGERSQLPGHIRSRARVAEACARSRWSNVACARCHRLARSSAGVGTDTTPADPGSKRADTHDREGERGRRGSEQHRQARPERPEGSTLRCGWLWPNPSGAWPAARRAGQPARRAASHAVTAHREAAGVDGMRARNLKLRKLLTGNNRP